MLWIERKVLRQLWKSYWGGEARRVLDSQESLGKDALVAKGSFQVSQGGSRFRTSSKILCQFWVIILFYFSFRAPKLYKVQACLNVPQSSVGKPELPFWGLLPDFPSSSPSLLSALLRCCSLPSPWQDISGEQGRASAPWLGGALWHPMDCGEFPEGEGSPLAPWRHCTW